MYCPEGWETIFGNVNRMEKNEVKFFQKIFFTILYIIIKVKNVLGKRLKEWFIKRCCNFKHLVTLKLQ